MPGSYIYHITCGKYIYIGQSKAEKGEPRIHQHIMNLFIRDDSSYPNLAREVRAKGLKNTFIRIYSGDLYGVSSELMDSFKRRFKKNNGKELDNIDAAEILHILYYKHNNKLILENKSIGGQDLSIMMAGRDDVAGKEIGIVSEKKGFITKFMTIDDAYWAFTANNFDAEVLYSFRDKFNEVMFTDK